MRQNITIALERDVLRKARALAAERGASVSRLLAEELERLVADAESYSRAREAALADIERGLRLGGRPAARDQLHER